MSLFSFNLSVLQQAWEMMPPVARFTFFFLYCQIYYDLDVQLIVVCV
jgi:hypothetical protein